MTPPDAGGVAHVAGGYEGSPPLAVLVIELGPGLEQELDTGQVTRPAGGSQGSPQLRVMQIHLKQRRSFQAAVGKKKHIYCRIP